MYHSMNRYFILCKPNHIFKICQMKILLESCENFIEFLAFPGPGRELHPAGKEPHPLNLAQVGVQFGNFFQSYLSV
jgi:hypothetical protein